MWIFSASCISVIFYDNQITYFLFFILLSSSFQIFCQILILTYHCLALGPRAYPTLPGFCPKTYFSKTYTFNTWFESSLKKENFGTKHDSVSLEIKKLWAKNENHIVFFSRFSIFGFFFFFSYQTNAAR